jgi:hypothetical protein
MGSCRAAAVPPVVEAGLFVSWLESSAANRRLTMNGSEVRPT